MILQRHPGHFNVHSGIQPAKPETIARKTLPAVTLKHTRSPGTSSYR
ncbi:MAG TPA: hypothetical protein PLV45_14605 [bacterium]|nr:hypothetical protein [bacterium]